MKPKDDESNVQDLVNAGGAIAELSLVFYRAAIAQDATEREALRTTQAYIAALMGSGGQPPTEENADE